MKYFGLIYLNIAQKGSTGSRILWEEIKNASF
ncbi:hypothetical protein WSI_03450 [Candidatus Liberibacter asiaticus str. gxpsy]|uniref:Uncharacterized protein n=2 Tax=Liberibacter asiaticus TaxID=34021 RepID=C6XF22_LIBAP|nr:hypothetical protein CLIBASIA_01940 [Candidatus Liberibacter asiaticus str. psy62]AGH17060.1 hypothetical protein WSI_03450 [Candidatus Liberibacter asiaticus str. gxpsy]